MYCNAYNPGAITLQLPFQMSVKPVSYLETNMWEEPVLDRDPITPEEYRDVEISLAEMQRGEYTEIPENATEEDIRNILLAMRS